MDRETNSGVDVLQAADNPSLAREDIEVIEHLKSKLVIMKTPPYGSDSWYTQAVGLFLGTTNKDWTNYVYGVNNDGHVVEWAYKAVEEKDRRHARDAELYVLTRVEEFMSEDAAGTLYMAQTKGPCRSCRKIIKTVFMPYYANVDVIIWYRQQSYNDEGMMYGIGDAQKHSSGWVAKWRSAARRRS